jgi:uncharacterized protein (DUF362 family)
MKKGITRREFVTMSTAVALGAGLTLKTGCRRSTGLTGKGRVLEVINPAAVSEGRKVDPDTVRHMVQQGMVRLTGDKKPWSRFFSPQDRIGLKINTLGRPLLYTHHELIQGVVDELTEFGIPPNNIIVWDRWEHHMLACGFVLNTSADGVCCYGAHNPRDKAVFRWDSDVVYVSDFDDSEDRGEEGTSSPFSSIITRECDKIINMPILKDHSNSGITFCLKNMAYGFSSNNGRFHKPAFISTFIADFCAHPLVREKVVLHIGDGLEGCFDRGPDPDSPRVLFTPNTLYLGTDPVAMDAVARSVIDDARVTRGLTPVAETPGYYEGMRPSDHIEMAAQNGIGICDPARMNLEKILL